MEMFPNRRWLIIDATMVPQINWNQILESSPQGLRYSVDGTKTFVKYEVTVVEQDYQETYIDVETGQEVTYWVYAGTYGRPDIYQEGMTEYKHQEMLDLLSGPEWTTPMENLN
jgi:hypothetical protein